MMWWSFFLILVEGWFAIALGRTLEHLGLSEWRVALLVIPLNILIIALIIRLNRGI